MLVACLDVEMTGQTLIPRKIIILVREMKLGLHETFSFKREYL